MIERGLFEVTRDGYAIWRGSFCADEVVVPPHWDQLTEREQQGFMAVAAYATNITVETITDRQRSK